jgi:histidinol-phosphate aminotransferase
MRIGLAFGQPSLLQALIRIKDSFNSYPLDRLAQAAGLAALEDEEWLIHNRAAVMKSRDWLTGALQGLGFQVLPSAANFVFARHASRQAAEIAHSLRSQKILVRHFQKPRIEHWLRITVGTDAECFALIRALEQVA